MAKRDFSTSVTTHDSKTGLPTKTVSKTPVPKTRKTVNPGDASFYQKYGIYSDILSGPEWADIRSLIDRAQADYKNGKEWTDEKFWDEYNKTQFAKDRNRDEELFDLGMASPDADTWSKKVDDEFAQIKQSAQRLGLNIPDSELRAQAEKMVRSGLPATSLDAYWQSTYLKGTEQVDDSSLMMGAPVAGTASDIQDQLKTLANNYGIRVTNDLLREKTGEALGQGERWREWISGQEDFFRQQAKILYPKASEMLNNMNLRQISEPYFADAAETLGLSVGQMDLLDPKWTGFLNGENGVLSRDEWERVLKTDSRYGWDKTTKARQEYSSLADSLLSAFGMA
jgi:hypothetical protein